MATELETKLSENPAQTEKDIKALTKEQQDTLNQQKVSYYSTSKGLMLQFIWSRAREQIDIRIDNERYLRSHPEINALIGGFVRYI